MVRDAGVKSDRIRLLAAADGTLPGYEAFVGSSGVAAPKPTVLNENTGTRQILRCWVLLSESSKLYDIGLINYSRLFPVI